VIPFAMSASFVEARRPKFSLLDLWHQAEAVKQRYGAIHDGRWFHIATPVR